MGCGTRQFTFVVIVMIAVLLSCASSAYAFGARSSQSTAAERAVAVRVAMSKLHSPYMRGAIGPRRFDCSGLVNFAYRRAGFPLSARSSYDLYEHGAIVARRALRPGDLVWTWDRAKGHVGIYIGNGRYVHAPGFGRRVEVATLPTGRDYLGAVRP